MTRLETAAALDVASVNRQQPAVHKLMMLKDIQDVCPARRPPTSSPAPPCPRPHKTNHCLHQAGCGGAGLLRCLQPCMARIPCAPVPESPAAGLTSCRAARPSEALHAPCPLGSQTTQQRAILAATGNSASLQAGVACVSTAGRLCPAPLLRARRRTQGARAGHRPEGPAPVLHGRGAAGHPPDVAGAAARPHAAQHQGGACVRLCLPCTAPARAATSLHGAHLWGPARHSAAGTPGGTVEAAAHVPVPGRERGTSWR